jgi:hypothetical protein
LKCNTRKIAHIYLKPTPRSSNPSIVAQEGLDDFGPAYLHRLLRLAKEKLTILDVRPLLLKAQIGGDMDETASATKQV